MACHATELSLKIKIYNRHDWHLPKVIWCCAELRKSSDRLWNTFLPVCTHCEAYGYCHLFFFLLCPRKHVIWECEKQINLTVHGNTKSVISHPPSGFALIGELYDSLAPPADVFSELKANVCDFRMRRAGKALEIQMSAEIMTQWLQVILV